MQMCNHYWNWEQRRENNTWCIVNRSWSIASTCQFATASRRIANLHSFFIVASTTLSISIRFAYIQNVHSPLGHYLCHVMSLLPFDYPFARRFVRRFAMQLLSNLNEICIYLSVINLVEIKEYAKTKTIASEMKDSARDTESQTKARRDKASQGKRTEERQNADKTQSNK